MNQEYRYGFKAENGDVKKLLTIRCSIDNDMKLTQLVAIQVDFKLAHVTLHGKTEEKESRIHRQLNKNLPWAQRTLSEFPEIIVSPLPDWNDLQYPIEIIRIPVMTYTNHHKKMKAKNTNSKETCIIDLSNIPKDKEYAGFLVLYLLPVDCEDKFKRKAGEYKYNLVTAFKPWIGVIFEINTYKKRQLPLD